MSKQVMQQALDALLGYKPHSLTHAKEQGSAIIALRAAIAQPVQPAAVGAVEPDKGLPYGIIDPDYARIFTIARALAWAEGYSIAMQGSFTRDLDLLAVPWTDSACDPKTLVRRIEQATGLKDNGHPASDKPHGRRTWTLVFPTFADPRWVDFSVMPRIAAIASKEVAK